MKQIKQRNRIKLVMQMRWKGIENIMKNRFFDPVSSHASICRIETCSV
ncbi:hypothetical protein M942_10305 [Enterobacter ludwigii]|nr:hypothetical protein M942_10305 [Enterobacter ludwigii]